MTIDEAIAHARKIAERNRKDLDEVIKDSNKYSKDTDSIIEFEKAKALEDIADGCTRCAEEHEQIAEWLEELKMLRELKNEHRKVGNIEGYNAGYKKAIDDFERKLISHLSDWSEAPFNDDETDRTRETICETIENAIGAVEEIAEQLKEGGAEE